MDTAHVCLVAYLCCQTVFLWSSHKDDASVYLSSTQVTHDAKPVESSICAACLEQENFDYACDSIKGFVKTVLTNRELFLNRLELKNTGPEAERCTKKAREKQTNILQFIKKQRRKIKKLHKCVDLHIGIDYATQEESTEFAFWQEYESLM